MGRVDFHSPSSEHQHQMKNGVYGWMLRSEWRWSSGREKRGSSVSRCRTAPFQMTSHTSVSSCHRTIWSFRCTKHATGMNALLSKCRGTESEKDNRTCYCFTWQAESGGWPCSTVSRKTWCCLSSTWRVLLSTALYISDAYMAHQGRSLPSPGCTGNITGNIWNLGGMQWIFAGWSINCMMHFMMQLQRCTVFWLCSMRDLSSPARDGTCAPCFGSAGP